MKIGDVSYAAIRLYDADGKLLADVQGAKFKYGTTRISSYATMNQRKLDVLIADHPTATRATIDNSEFVIAADGAGRRFSSWKGTI